MFSLSSVTTPSVTTVAAVTSFMHLVTKASLAETHSVYRDVYFDFLFSLGLAWFRL